MEVTINYNGQALSVEVTVEVYEYLDRADHKTENLAHEQRRHWDGREFDEYIAFTEGVGVYSETPEEYLCRMETLHELMAVLDTWNCSHSCCPEIYVSFSFNKRNISDFILCLLLPTLFHQVLPP